jgi:hypothetical protein
VVEHIAYHEQQYQSADECLEAMRNFIGHGWEVTWIGSPGGGAHHDPARKTGGVRAGTALTEGGRRIPLRLVPHRTGDGAYVVRYRIQGDPKSTGRQAFMR